MGSPTYSAPTNGSPLNGGLFTQFETTHPSQLVYQGTSQVTGAAASSGTVASDTGAAQQFIDQPFTTAVAQTTITRVEFNPGITGSGADVTLTLYTDSAGSPSAQVAGVPTITIPLEFCSGTLSIPFPITGLTAVTKYHWIIAPGTSTNANFDTFQVGTTVGSQYQTASSIGGPWTGGGKTLLFTVYAGVGGNLRHTYEDSGARWSVLNYSGTNSTVLLNKTWEFTAQASPAQSGVGRSTRTISYTSGQITSIA